MESYILLENIEFYAYHGVFAQEALVGNSFVVNLRINVDVDKAILSDNVCDTVSYASVYDIIKKEMEVNSNLIEHVAGQMISSLKKQFPQIKQIELKLSKMNPPVGGQIESASILIID